MCGRYVITKPILKTRDIVKSVIVFDDIDNYNAHPQQKLPVIKSYSNGKTLEALQWGLTPNWVVKQNVKPLINARLETLKEKITFTHLIKNNRCLALADGYYEWKIKENSKVPYYFTRNDKQTLFFAAIFDHHQFTIITQPADTQVGTIHYRQPVIINDEDIDKYFNLKIEGTNFLQFYESPNLKFYPVGKDVNKPTNNRKQLIMKLK